MIINLLDLENIKQAIKKLDKKELSNLRHTTSVAIMEAKEATIKKIEKTIYNKLNQEEADEIIELINIQVYFTNVLKEIERALYA